MRLSHSSACHLIAMLAFSALACCVSWVTAAADKCHLRELDLCAASAAGVNKIPVNDEELDKYCALGDETQKCVNAYLEQCATPLQKEFYAWLTKDPLKSTANFCTKNTTMREEYLTHALCLARAQPENKVCVDDAHAAFEKLERVKFANRVPTACCTLQRYVECSTGVVRYQCGQRAVDQAAGFFQKDAGVSLNLLCQGYVVDGEQCKQLLPPTGSKPTGTSKSLMGRLFNAYVHSGA